MKNKYIFSQLIDYVLLFTLFITLRFSFSVNSIFFFTLPLSSALVEGVFLSIFKTTPGKWIYGIFHKKRYSLLKNTTNSLKKGLLILPLFFPPLNIFFIRYYLKESPKHFEQRWGKGDFCMKKRNPFLRNSLIAISCFFLAFQLSPLSKGFKKPNFTVESWVEVKDDNLKFSIFFPEEPEISEKKIEIKEQNTTLNITEYQHKSHINYTLHSTKVPTTWTLLGSTYLLKALGKQITTYQGSFIDSKIGTHNKYPALHYLLKNHDGGQTKGALILVGKKVYKLEVTGDKDLTDKELEISKNFISSFNII